jgi:ATP-binding cassette subfamily B (MDR/TAP) protein 1
MVTKGGADDHTEADLELSDANRNLDAGGDSDPKAAAAADAPQTVSFFRLFEFADSLDRVLLLFGTAASIANGLTFPFMTLLFGQVIDAFGKNAAYSDTVQREVAKVIDYAS